MLSAIHAWFPGCVLWSSQTDNLVTREIYVLELSKPHERFEIVNGDHVPRDLGKPDSLKSRQ
jgi:hypothetical protein